MAERDETDVSMKGAPACGQCHMLVACFAPQVHAASGVYHRECYEAWYFGRHRRRPRLLAGTNGDRHRYRVPDDGREVTAPRAA
jgi:hypothetical protein